ncbi:MAG TPA: hypothetical protein VI112_18520 [Bacteroidia bacterium]|jgi:hypothetical protein
MKYLNKTLLVLLAALFMVPFAAAAQPVRKVMGEKMASRRVLIKTGFVIHHAYKLVKENKVYTGNLARAIAHQKYARQLYREGKYFRAMHQSRRARYFALLAIKANKGNESDDMKYSPEDEKMMTKNAPRDADLDKEMQTAMPNAPTKDEAVIDTEPDVDLKDNE